jgi:hypothetical protein
MKFPKSNAVMQPIVYVFWLVFFVVGHAVVAGLSLGQIKDDDREEQGWNPISKMPDGKLGFLESTIGGIRFAALAIGFAALLGLA